MAADVKAPRFSRSTTNMEDAALAAARRGESEQHLDRTIIRKIIPRGADASFGNVLKVVEDLDRAWDAWAEPDPVKAMLTPPEAVYRAGYEAIGDARWRAHCVLRATPAATVPELASKSAYILNEIIDNNDDKYVVFGLESILTDFASLIARPDADAFALKVRAWEQTWADRDAYDKENRPADVSRGITPETEAWEEGRSPFNEATEAAAMAVLRCPAPDAAALEEKRRVFKAEEMDTCAYASSELVEVLFADAARLAGGGQ